MRDESLNISFTNDDTPVQGCLLLSDPFLVDDYFQRSVIFLCNVDEEGAFGFVLNNYIDSSKDYFNELFPKYSGVVSLGGPVDNTSLFYLHTLGNLIDDALPIFGNLYLGGNFEQLCQLLNEDEEKAKSVRFFVGYSGWSHNQLTEELELNTWKVVKNYPLSKLFNKFNDDIWKEIMREQGLNYTIYSNSPVDPSNN